MTDAPLKPTAVAAYRAGICLLPVRQDGTKRPDVPSWTEYQRRQPTTGELGAWFNNGRTGIGAVCGAVSGNLEPLDFDKDPALYPEYREAAEALGMGELLGRVERGYCEMTPSGGIHLLYRSPVVEGSKELAQRVLPDGRRETLIETRGEGGFIVLAPSFGTVHPSGQPYTLLSGGFDTIATITAEEREALHNLARTFDQAPPPPPTVNYQPSDREGNRPGDDFERRTSWPEILQPHGWSFVTERNGTSYWRRPGKDRDWSATTGHGGHDVFYVFTSSTQFEPMRGYRKFTVYTYLNYDRDFKAAASALGKQGYGQQFTGFRPSVREPKPEDSPELAATLERVRQLEEENYRQAELIHFTGQVLGNHNIGPGERIVFIKLAFEVAHQLQNPVAPAAKTEGHTVVRLSALAEAAGVSPNTASKYLGKFHEWGLIDKQVRRTTTPEGNPVNQLEVRLPAPTPPEALATVARVFVPPTPRNHGGKRVACPKCGSERVTKMCEDCGHQWPDPADLPPPPLNHQLDDSETIAPLKPQDAVSGPPPSSPPLNHQLDDLERQGGMEGETPAHPTVPTYRHNPRDLRPGQNPTRGDP